MPPETLLTDILGGCDVMNNPYPSAYHDSGSYQGTTFSYAMVPICTATTIGWTETGAAHELFEAATDAVPRTDPAYQFPLDSPWESLFGELADLCEYLPSAEVEGFTSAAPLVEHGRRGERRLALFAGAFRALFPA